VSKPIINPFWVLIILLLFKLFFINVTSILKGVQDRAVEVDEENTCQVEDEDLLKEIEEDERKTDEEKARAAAKPKE
jgi:hypothetical protein